MTSINELRHALLHKQAKIPREVRAEIANLLGIHQVEVAQRVEAQQRAGRLEQENLAFREQVIRAVVVASKVNRERDTITGRGDHDSPGRHLNFRLGYTVGVIDTINCLCAAMGIFQPTAEQHAAGKDWGSSDDEVLASLDGQEDV